jgi:FMN phosphatase YigB (HAD superfamily)
MQMIVCVRKLHSVINVPHTSMVSDLIAVNVLKDLEAIHYLDPILLSSKEQLQKPSRNFFLRACHRARVRPEETLHVGDDLERQVYYDS